MRAGWAVDGRRVPELRPAMDRLGQSERSERLALKAGKAPGEPAHQKVPKVRRWWMGPARLKQLPARRTRVGSTAQELNGAPRAKGARRNPPAKPDQLIV